MDVPAYHDGGTRQDAFSGSEKPFHLVMRRLSSIAQVPQWAPLIFGSNVGMSGGEQQGE